MASAAAVEFALSQGFELREIALGDLSVKYRGDDLWAVTQPGGACLNRDGGWEYEPMPSARDRDFLVRCRFRFEEAVAMAWSKRTAAEPAESLPSDGAR
jgi:hypothetical protein